MQRVTFAVALYMAMADAVQVQHHHHWMHHQSHHKPGQFHSATTADHYHKGFDPRQAAYYGLKYMGHEHKLIEDGTVAAAGGEENDEDDSENDGEDQHLDENDYYKPKRYRTVYHFARLPHPPHPGYGYNPYGGYGGPGYGYSPYGGYGGGYGGYPQYGGYGGYY